jgi:signal transduction histidine kinase
MLLAVGLGVASRRSYPWQTVEGALAGSAAVAFARDTGSVTARRWVIMLSLYLGFAGVSSVIEWQIHPGRGAWLLGAYLLQALIGLMSTAIMRAAPVHPRSAWVALAGTLGVAFVIAGMNAAVGGDLLYVLLTYIPLVFVTSLLIPWGAAFQMALGGGVAVAHTLAALSGARAGPVPAYEYTALAATIVFSSLGAMYIDQSRRRLFAQASALREMNQQLATSNQARSELLSGLSHDMRAPLGVVMGYAEMLADASLSPGEADLAVRGIRREALQLLSLVDGVLDLARLEVGRMPFDPVPFELAVALQPLRATAEDSLRSRSVRLVWSVPAGLIVHSDLQNVRNVVRNLLSNAVKYTPVGEIRVSATELSDGVQIVVADTGVGIALEDLGRIFEAFERGNGRASDLEPGLGFGLYTVKLLLRLAGGRIAVDSTQGKGSTFRVWLPAQPPGAVR